MLDLFVYALIVFALVLAFTGIGVGGTETGLPVETQSPSHPSGESK